MPYVLPAKRLLLCASQKHGISTDCLAMLQDPEQFFKRYGACKIFVLHPDNADNSREKDEDKDVEEYEEPIYLGESDLQDFREYNREYNSEVVEKNGVVPFIAGSHYANKELLWKFRVENIKFNEDETLLASVEVLLAAHSGDFSRILADETLLRQLQQIYKEYFKGNKLNDTSLVVRHAPLGGNFHLQMDEAHIFEGSVSQMLLSRRDFNKRPSCCNFCCCLQDCRHHICAFECFGPSDIAKEQNCATVLFGDLNVNPKVLADLQQSKLLCCDEAVLQLPHHGSVRNCSGFFDAGYLTAACCNTMLVASYGQSNSYKHPSIERKLHCLTKARLAHVNEYCCCRYSIC
jgi:hypothetical protein